MPKVGCEHLHGNWSDEVAMEALPFLAAELSVMIENLKVNSLCVCVFAFSSFVVIISEVRQRTDDYRSHSWPLEQLSNFTFPSL